MTNKKNNRLVVPGAKQAIEQMKYEIASELGVNLKQGYYGDLTSKQACQIGGEMVKKLVAKAANDMQNGMN